MTTQRIKALALDYQADSMQAPKVSAIGSDKVATAMLKQARRCGIPVVVSDRIIKSIDTCELDQEVPQEMYLDLANFFAKYQIE